MGCAIYTTVPYKHLKTCARNTVFSILISLPYDQFSGDLGYLFL